MNLRQKAKHFKKLYESGLPKKPYPIIHETHESRHYKVQFAAHEVEIACAQSDTSLYKTMVVNGILEELRPIIRENLKQERDFYIGKIIYSLDIWV